MNKTKTKLEKIRMLKLIASGKTKLNPLASSWKARMPMLEKSNRAELSALINNPFITHQEAIAQMSDSLLQNMITVLKKTNDDNELTDAERAKLAFYDKILDDNYGNYSEGK